MIFNHQLYTANDPITPEFAKAWRVLKAYGPLAWGKQ